MGLSQKKISQWFAGMAMSAAIATLAWPFAPVPTWAQVNRIQQATELVYAELPEFPLENTYASGDGAQPANTLVRRVLAYHVYTQGRPTQSRTDWKLTIADYLDLNEPMYAGSYPSADVLTTNPYTGDRAVIQGLSREERNELLAAIFKAYSVDIDFQALELAGQTTSTPSATGTSVETVPDVREVVPERSRPPARGTADQLL